MLISLCKPKHGPKKHILIPGEMKDCKEYYVLSVHEVDCRPNTHCFYYDGPGCMNLRLGKLPIEEGAE